MTAPAAAPLFLGAILAISVASNAAVAQTPSGYVHCTLEHESRTENNHGLFKADPELYLQYGENLLKANQSASPMDGNSNLCGYAPGPAMGTSERVTAECSTRDGVITASFFVDVSGGREQAFTRRFDTRTLRYVKQISDYTGRYSSRGRWNGAFLESTSIYACRSIPTPSAPQYDDEDWW